MKTLKEFVKKAGYTIVKAPDEQKFIDKHTTIEAPDRNGNSDDVFKAAKVKQAVRKAKRLGYETGADAKVYEEVESIEEANFVVHKDKKIVSSHATNAAAEKAAKAKGAGYHVASHAFWQDKIKEERIAELNAIQEQINLLQRKQHTVGASPTAQNKRLNEQKQVLRAQYDELYEKHLTAGELTKREEVAKAIERENPGIDKSKKMAIATATAKKVAEEVIDEGLGPIQKEEYHVFKDGKLVKNHGTSSSAANKHAGEVGGEVRRLKIYKNGRAQYHIKEEIEVVDEKIKAADRKDFGLLGTPRVPYNKDAKKKAPIKEAVEPIEEISSDLAGRYADTVRHKHGDGIDGYSKGTPEKRKTGRKLALDKKYGGKKYGFSSKIPATNESLYTSFIDRYVSEEALPKTLDEKLAERLITLSESHKATLTSLFNTLTEDNKVMMLERASTAAGINGLLDFAIQNRG